MIQDNFTIIQFFLVHNFCPTCMAIAPISSNRLIDGRSDLDIYFVAPMNHHLYDFKFFQELFIPRSLIPFNKPVAISSSAIYAAVAPRIQDIVSKDIAFFILYFDSKRPSLNSKPILGVLLVTRKRSLPH